jgi:hypothetical protein
MSKLRVAVACAATLAAALGVGAAQARDADVRWSVTIGSPVPVYGPPPLVPIYRVPQPVYHPYPVVVYRAPTHWDRDGDGVPNRYDRVYNPVWDRDGDGIPNRYERRGRPYGDRDRDGTPNRWDRYDDNPWRR